jgi:Uma2 family endonuclease
MNDAPPLPRHKLQITQFHQMRVAGIFGSEDRIELLEGELIDMSPIGPAHSGKTNQLTRLLSQAVANTAIVSVQNPVMLSEDSEPQPDLAILRWREDFYATIHPQPQDILLISVISYQLSVISYQGYAKLSTNSESIVQLVTLSDVI